MRLKTIAVGGNVPAPPGGGPPPPPSASSKGHVDAVTAVTWAANGTLLSASDDGTIGSWSADGTWQGVVASTPDYGATDIHCSPSAPDTFAVAGSDGSLRLFGRGGREEKAVPASPAGGAIVSVRWSYDGAAIATGGEDGSVKVWSRAAMLRTTLVQAPKPVYVVRWGADSNSLLYASGRELTIAALSGEGGAGAGGENAAQTAASAAGGATRGTRGLTWKAHDGVVLCADWNPVTSRIVSGGEDCIYRVWDSYGRTLFSSAPFSTVVTSIAWAPSGEHFAAGTFGTLRLCNHSGWSTSREPLPTAGSVLGMAWTSDGTTLAGAGGSGAVVFGQLLGRSKAWGAVEITLTAPNKITVSDGSSEVTEELEFKDRVCEMSIGYGHCVVATTTQCHVYSTSQQADDASGAWHAHSPHTFEQRAPVHLILQSPKHFAMVDNSNGVQVFTYDGRVISSPKYPGLHVEFLSRTSLSLAPDSIAILDKTDGKTIRCFEVRSGRPIGTPIVHSTTIASIALSQGTCATITDRRIAFVDSTNDLYISQLIKPVPVKLCTNVDAMAWNDAGGDMLLALADKTMVTWLYPTAVFVDPDLAAATKVEASPSTVAACGHLPSIVSFSGARVSVRRGDGAIVTAPVATYPPLLFAALAAGKWPTALRLCRFVKSAPLWAALACAAIHAKQLDTAEIALAAAQIVDKVHWVQYVRGLKLPEMRNAELALYRRAPDEAEALLLQATPPLIYRAIKLNIRLGRWQRALDIALQQKQYADTVLWYRASYLEGLKRTETLESYKRAATTVTVVEADILARKATDKEAERFRGEKAAAAEPGGTSGGGLSRPGALVESKDAEFMG